MKNANVFLTMAAAALALAAWAAPSVAQEDAGTGLVADPNGAAPEDLLSQLSPEELEKLVRKADALRLTDERERAVDEIRAGSLYAEDAKDAAAKLLDGKGAGTQADNIERIAKAFAKVDPAFRRAYQLFLDGKHKECAEAAKQLLKPDETDFNSAAKHFLHAEALAKWSVALAAEANAAREAREVLFDAIEAYKTVVELMSERISFASVAAQKAGKMYEDAGRNINALKMYSVVLRNYSITLTAAEREALLTKLEQWMEIYKNPLAVLKHVSGKMGGVEKRLAAKDSGKETRDEQRQIVMVLEDLIKTIEEQAQAQSQGQGQGQAKEKKKGEGEGEGEGEGKGKGKGEGKGKGKGPPSGTQQPSSPARSSFLPGGDTVRPGKLETPHITDEKGDWSQLPPTERERLVEVMKKHMSERMGSQIRDYSTALSDAERTAPRR